MNRQFFRFAILALLGLFLSGAALAQSLDRNADTAGTPDISLQVASHWGGPVNAAVVEGNRAYIANGRVFRILDLTDETNPVEMGSLELGSQWVGPSVSYEEVDGVRDIRIRGNFAYVGAAGQHFFSIVDVANPQLPNLIRSFSRFGSDRAIIATDVGLNGDYAYVAQEVQGSIRFEIFDIRNPLNVASVGMVESRGGPMLIHDDRLYRGGTGEGQSTGATIDVFDLASNPTNPPRIGAWGLRNVYTRTLAASGNYIYLVVNLHSASDEPFGPIQPGGYGLAVVDVLDPTLPTVVDIQDISTGIEGAIGVGMFQVAIGGGHLFIADRHRSAPVEAVPASIGGLRIYDIAANPARPMLVGQPFREHGDIVHTLASTNNRLYVTDSAEGFVILDTTNPAWPRRLGKYHSPELLGKLVLDGDLLYVSDSDGGFTILDVSVGQDPRVIGNYLARRHSDRRIEAWGIDKAGDFIYLAAGNSGLITVDVSDPTRPQTAGLLRIPELGFAATTSPASMFLGLTVRDQTAYIGYAVRFPTSIGSALVTVDVSDPLIPEFRGATLVDPSKAPDAIEIDGQFATLNGGRGQIVDISDPAAPVVVHTPALSFPVTDGVFLPDGLRLTSVWANHPSSEYDGLHIQNVSDPANPSTLSWIKTGQTIPDCGVFPSGALSLATSTDARRAYLRTFDSIFVFDIENPSNLSCLTRLDGLSQGLDRKIGMNDHTSRNTHRSDLLASENRLYSTSNTLGLSILDVRDDEPPIIAVEPKALTAALRTGQQQHVPLRIRNRGGSVLHWYLDTTSRGCDDPASLQWLRLVPDAGRIGANASDIPVGTFNAAGRKPDSYRATLCLRSNDAGRPVMHLDARLDIRNTDIRM